MDYELLKREIILLDSLRIDLQYTEKYPDIGFKLDILLSDMQRVTSRIAELLNPDEGGMLVSEKVETPHMGDLCLFWQDEITAAALRPYERSCNGLYVDAWTGEEWAFCKVIKKGVGNV